MKITDWTVSIGIAVVGAAVVYGALQNKVSNHDARLITLEGWKDNAIAAMSQMDAKLDLLLQANGITPPRKKP